MLCGVLIQLRWSLLFSARNPGEPLTEVFAEAVPSLLWGMGSIEEISSSFNAKVLVGNIIITPQSQSPYRYTCKRINAQTGQAQFTHSQTMYYSW